MSNDPNYPLLMSNFLQTELAEGSYTVRLIDLNTGCITIDHVDVGDARIYPEIMIVEDNPLINCDPERANGQLSATADGGKVGGYSFDWYAGTTATGSTLSNNNKLIGQTVGSYTVKVTRNLTGCSNELVGNITDGTVLPPTPTALLIQGRTSCIEPNGWVAANVKGVTLDYIFNWYDGSAPQGSADFTGVNYIKRDVGPHAVTATDLVTGCISLPGIIEVPDERVIPEVKLLSTPSFCLRPTGSVTLELITPNVVLSDISWYDEALGTQIGSGPATYELPAGFYRALFISSEGCENEAVVEIGTEILSYNLVSANGDNSNDVWIIDCIQNFPSNNVKVFNRSGVKVFEATGYNNVDVLFRGIGERGVYTLGNDLPDGTYFYIIDKRDGSKPINGYLELVR
jgi:gliding motility-associated-like protein